MLPEKDDVYFSSDNLDMYLKELAKEFRKLNGKTVPAEVHILRRWSSIQSIINPFLISFNS